MICTNGSILVKAHLDRIPGQPRVRRILDELAKEIGPTGADLIGELLELVVRRLDPSQDVGDVTRRAGGEFRSLKEGEFVFLIMPGGERRVFTVQQLDEHYDDQTVIADLAGGEWMAR